MSKKGTRYGDELIWAKSKVVDNVTGPEASALDGRGMFETMMPNCPVELFVAPTLK